LIRRYYGRVKAEERSKIITCGTALWDLDYLNYTDNFMQLTDYGQSLEYAGYQILAKIYSNTLERIKKVNGFRIAGCTG